MRIQRSKEWWLEKARKEDGATVISAGIGIADFELAELVMANTRKRIVIPASGIVTEKQ